MAATQPIVSEVEVLVSRLIACLGDSTAGRRLKALVVGGAPDERLALAVMLNLGEESPELMNRLLGDEILARNLVFCLGASELIGAELASMGSGWADFFRAASSHTANSLLQSMRFDPPVTGEKAELTEALRSFKQHHFLSLAIADLLGHLSVEETMTVMSALADECIRGAYAITARVLGERIRPMGSFCVLAMGKLGACELNLSSDIDLLYLSEAEEPQAGQEAAAKFGETLTEVLSTNCFRVDLRLRPGGQKATLVPSLDGAIGFYQSFGQTWERAALLRARPVAGAVGMGARFIAELASFVYRRYLDFDTLSQLHAMKRQIDHELGAPELIERNIKLGRGGIRELEFAVQALALVYGGRDARLRESRTLVALQRLGNFDYLKPEIVRQLSDAYLFLRNVEHKLQVVAGLQTHSLPAGVAAMQALAARLGFGKQAQSLVEFAAALGRHREIVNHVFRELLAGEGQELTNAPAIAYAAWRTALEPERAAQELEKMAFARPAESANNLLTLARGPEHLFTSTRRRELLDNLGPVLLAEIAALPDPDLALRNVASFMLAVGARTSFLALLESHPATRATLLRLFASSSYLSTLFIRHPEMLDTLVRSDLARLRRSAADLDRELSGLLAAAADFEARLDTLRTFRHQEFLRIAIADLTGDLALEAVQAELTLLAEAVLREALALARVELGARAAVLDSMALCAVAMGRLGAAEMSYNSDLDLIFVYRDASTNGTASREAAPRLVQKLISILETRTREGYAYKLDLRLRPSGNAGPLVTSLDSFIEYHRHSSAVWERQALVRARVVAGDEALGAEVEAARRRFVFGRDLTASEIAEIAAMRLRMEREVGAEDHSRLNLKQGHGGLVDVEFIAHMLVLRHGKRHPDLIDRRATDDLLAALGRARIIPFEDCTKLRDHYRFLTKLENRLRIETDQAAWAVATDPMKLSPLARRMGIDGADKGAQLIFELKRRRVEVRALFDQFFSGERLGAH